MKRRILFLTLALASALWVAGISSAAFAQTQTKPSPERACGVSSARVSGTKTTVHHVTVKPTASEKTPQTIEITDRISMEGTLHGDGVCPANASAVAASVALTDVQLQQILGYLKEHNLLQPAVSTSNASVVGTRLDLTDDGKKVCENRDAGGKCAKSRKLKPSDVTFSEWMQYRMANSWQTIARDQTIALIPEFITAGATLATAVEGSGNMSQAQSQSQVAVGGAQVVQRTVQRLVTQKMGSGWNLK